MRVGYFGAKGDFRQMGKCYDIVYLYPESEDNPIKKVKLGNKMLAYVHSMNSAISNEFRRKKGSKEKEHGYIPLSKDGVKNLIVALQDTLDDINN